MPQPSSLSAAEGSHGADRSPLPWVGFSCPTPHLWGFAGLRGHFLPSDLISPTACFALAAGQPGSGLPLQLPLFTGPGRWTICSLILRKAVLQIWNCAHRQCSPYHPSGSSQCTSPKHLVSCIKPGLATRFIYDIIHVFSCDCSVSYLDKSNQSN